MTTSIDSGDVICVLLNLRKAFDWIDQDILIHTLKLY